MDHVTAVFHTRSAAEEALRRIESIGIPASRISLLMNDDTRANAFGFEKGTKTDKGMAAGATAGGLIGAVIGGVFSAGALAIPGWNLIVSGYLISALAGLGAGATAGGLVGGLIGLGFEENEAKFYEEEVKSGNILLAVETATAEEKKRVKEILDDADSYTFTRQDAAITRRPTDVKTARY